MVETVAGIWLFLLTLGAGFLLGRLHRKGQKNSRKHTSAAVTEDGFGWQELLNFLQYDGSGRQPSGKNKRGGETVEEQYHSAADSARIRTGRPL